MRYLLEHTERASEIQELARKYAEHAILRTYLRWHPGDVLRQPVRGVEWLTTRRDPGRSVVLSFMHHGWYEGLCSSLARAGAPSTILLSPKVLGPDTPVGLKRHAKLLHHRSPFIPAVGGLDAIQAQLRPGMTMAVASDVPGHTLVTFLGRQVLASFGAALMATRTNSQVVLATAHQGDDCRSFIQIHEPLEPEGFGEPLQLLQEMLRRHGEAVLAWPDALDTPMARWGIVKE